MKYSTLILIALFFATSARGQTTEKQLTQQQLSYPFVVQLNLASWLTIIENIDSKKLADSVRMQVIPQFNFMDKYRNNKAFRDSMDRISKPVKEGKK